MRATIVGAGSFGTALATVLSKNFDKVVLWTWDAKQAQSINATRQNTEFLPGIALDARIEATASAEEALQGAALVVFAVPSQVTREVVANMAPLLPEGVPLISAAKGIETDSCLTMTQVMEAVLPAKFHRWIGVLSGPSFAKEMVQRLPTVVTLAAKDEATRKVAQQLISTDVFRTYTSSDVVGVQLGGALKNIVAIAAGMSDGLGMGHNARAGIITRGLAEITRLAVKMGADPMTLAGLSGMGDLVLTCTGELSRNRHVGMELGKGRKLSEILQDMNQVAEGIKTAKSARDLALKMGVEMPICEQVYAIAYEDRDAKAAAYDLMTRSLKAEVRT